LGIVVLNVALPFLFVLPSTVTVGMPGMLRVNVMSALASAWPSGSVTVADRVMASGSRDRLIDSRTR
jgi:hypothetical protein